MFESVMFSTPEFTKYHNYHSSRFLKLFDFVSGEKLYQCVPNYFCVPVVLFCDIATVEHCGTVVQYPQLKSVTFVQIAWFF